MPSLAEITRELLASYGRHPRKRLGQHFLINPEVLQRIIDAAELTGEDMVLEIGTGLGVLTKELADRVEKVITIEIDKDFLKIAKDILKDYSNIEFIQGDFLKFDWSELWKSETERLGFQNFKVVANLPYYITAPIIEKLLSRKPPRFIGAGFLPSLIVLTLQKEVAERITAKPRSKAYGSFSIFCQYHAEAKLNSLVPRSAFWPQPEVSSAIITLKPYLENPFGVKDEKLFFDIVHAAFQQRRKKLKNSLAGFPLESSGIDLNRRAEMLSLEEFAGITNTIRGRDKARI